MLARSGRADLQQSGMSLMKSHAQVAVIGGGPGGLYFALLAKQLDPGREITVWERNAAGDTFGFGVVLSDETLGGIEQADAAVYQEMERGFARWDDIDIHYRGQVVTSGGQAELGRALGGYVNVVTKSGTNVTHGDAYGYFRDAALTGADFGGASIVGCQFPAGFAT